MTLAVALGAGLSARAQVPAALDPAVDAIERQLEVGRHEPLLARIAAADARLSAFSSDGCSGGLSAGWEQIAALFPEFAENRAEIPPWQDCCVAHDREYHRGGAAAGSAGECGVGREVRPFFLPALERRAARDARC